MRKRALQSTTQRKRLLKKTHVKVINRRKNFAFQQMENLIPTEIID